MGSYTIAGLRSIRHARSYMMYDIIVFENLRFRLSTRKRKAGVFKNFHSGERFWKRSVFSDRFHQILEDGFRFQHRRTGNFLPGGAVSHLPKNFRKCPKFLQKSRKETRAILQQHRPYWLMKVVRYSFSGSMPSLSINYVAINKH